MYCNFIFLKYCHEKPNLSLIYGAEGVTVPFLQQYLCNTKTSAILRSKFSDFYEKSFKPIRRRGRGDFLTDVFIVIYKDM